MKKKTLKLLLSLLFFGLSLATARAQDWPIYKGNLYFTGNNDEITVRGNKIRYIFRAKAKIVNPIVSEGRVYFLDLRKNVYSIDEKTGRLLWMLNLKKVSSQFKTSKRSFGKPKYPVIQGPHLFLSDSSVIYCINKLTGDVLWARTGMTNETNLGRHSIARVDGIYSDPVIDGDNIHYGTRNVFMARDIKNGHLKWRNAQVKSYSAFPTYYDKFLFTQSVVHAQKKYTIFCLDKATGKTLWQKDLPLPFKIFAPVVYKNTVYVNVGKTLYGLKLSDGSLLFKKEYDNYITSNPSFTDRDILFTIGNQDVLVVNPENGEIKSRKKTGQPSSPSFVTVRDQLYLASSEKRNFRGKPTTYTRLDTYLLGDEKPLWTFEAPLPGGPSQPVAAGGVLFLPGGQHLYALGKNPVKSKTGDDYLLTLNNSTPGDSTSTDKDDFDKNNSQGDNDSSDKDITDKDNTDGDTTGDSENGDDSDNAAEDKKIIADLFDQELVEDSTTTDDKRIEDKIIDDQSDKNPPVEEDKNEQKIPLRKLKVDITDKEGNRVPATVEVIKRFKGDIVFQKKYNITTKDTEIDVPDDNEVEIITSTKDYLPDKKIIDRKDPRVNIKLTRIQKGEKLSLDSIHFRSGKAYLMQGSLDILQKMATVLRAKPAIKLQIQGHTDSQGPKRFNQLLSEKRAEAVRDYLVKQGVSPVRLKTRGFGESRPVASNKTRAGRKKNRRTEFIVLEN